MNIIREKNLVIFIEEISSEKLHFLCSDEQSPFNSRTSPDIDYKILKGCILIFNGILNVRNLKQEIQMKAFTRRKPSIRELVKLMLNVLQHLLQDI